MSNLISENQMAFSPVIAESIGLNEAIVLHQIHYWIEIEKSKADDPKVREKHFHNGQWWIFNTYEQWRKQFPFWSTRTIKRIFANLEENGYIVTGNFNSYGPDRTKWYTINYSAIDSLETHSANLSQCKVTNLPDAKCNSDTTNTIDYQPLNPTIDSIQCKMDFSSRKTDIDYAIVYNQIRKACMENDYSDYGTIQKIFGYYYLCYKRVFGEDHPRLSQTAMNNAVYKLVYRDGMMEDVDLDAYKVLIDQYFNTPMDCDYNICHFVSGDIVDNRFYETLY